MHLSKFNSEIHLIQEEFKMIGVTINEISEKIRDDSVRSIIS